MLRLLTLFLAALAGTAQTPPPAVAKFLATDVALNTDVNSPLWRNAGVIRMTNGPEGTPVTGRDTEIRLRWSEDSLYLLFVCQYQGLFLKPSPETRTETNKLWEWDVGEVFIGGDFEKFWQYREYQVSPQGEWVDLDIDRQAAKPQGGWGWNSGFQVAARQHPESKTWFGAMKIPFNSIDQRIPKAGVEYRVNFYRLEGGPPNRTQVAWAPTGVKNHHVPEKFGLLRLEK